MIRIRANETKTFYIHAIPSHFDSFIIYLVNKTSFGEVLGYIDNQQTTGALISWFKKHFDEREMEFSTYIFLDDEGPITLDAIFRKIHAEGPLPESLQVPKSFTYKDTENHWLDLETLSEVHEALGEANLVFYDSIKQLFKIDCKLFNHWTFKELLVLLNFIRI